MSDFGDELKQLKAQLSALEHRLGERYLGPQIDDSPVRGYRQVIQDSGDPGYTNRILIATPTTGLVRMEWVAGRYGQIIPANWSHVEMHQWLSGYIPLRYQVADAQNLIVREVVQRDMEWCLLIEHDTIPPPDAFVRWNRYMIEEQVPVVSGLYYTRGRPAEPLVFRGRGTSFYRDWQFGDRVWCDGVPTGALLIHGGLLRAMWAESEEYEIKHANGQVDVTRRVFDTPRHSWFDPETGQYNTFGGTSDLAWCARIMQEGFFKKAGWAQHQEMAYPFLVDTAIFCRHIDPDGQQYP